MGLDLSLAIAHHLAFLVVFAVLVMEFALLRLPLTKAAVGLIARVDLGYGIAAGVSVAVGLTRVFQGAKGSVFYSHNPIFWAKMVLFTAIGLISIFPTLRYVRWNRATELPALDEVARVRQLVALQLGLFAGLPALAALMARGIGL